LAKRRNKHRHRLSVLFVSVAVLTHEVTLFELNRDQNVSRRCDRKEQMRRRHQRRHPECEEPTNVKRMSHEPVWTRRHKLRLRIAVTAQVSPHLTHAKQVEVIDQES